MNLYQIDNNIKSLMEIMQEEGMELEAFQESLNTLEGMENDKIDNIISYVKNLKSEIVALKNEEKVLKERRIAKEKQSANLLEYLQGYMEGKDIKKFETTRNVLSVRKTPTSVKIQDSNNFIKWAEYFHRDLLKETIAPNLTAIKEYINEGNEIPDVTLESGQSLNIK